MKKHIFSGLFVVMFFFMACEQNPLEAPQNTPQDQQIIQKRAGTQMDEATPDKTMPAIASDYSVYIRKGYEASGAWQNGARYAYLNVSYDYENESAHLSYSVYQNNNWIAGGHGSIPAGAITGDERLGYLTVDVDTGELDDFHIHRGEPLVVSATWTVNSDWVRYTSGRDVYTDNRTGYSSYYKGRRNYRSADGRATLGNWAFTQERWGNSIWLAKFKRVHASHYGTN